MRICLVDTALNARTTSPNVGGAIYRALLCDAIYRALVDIQERGRNELRPYHNDAVNMIGHDHEFIDCHARETAGQSVICCLDNVSSVVRVHGALSDFT